MMTLRTDLSGMKKGTGARVEEEHSTLGARAKALQWGLVWHV
jgi:hypothetical protein